MSFRRGDMTELKPGMTFHFMPALWLDDGGLEITEPILITDTGVECLLRDAAPGLREMTGARRTRSRRRCPSTWTGCITGAAAALQPRRQRLGLGDDPDHGDPERCGPTALFTGANHGDEYEGPIALAGSGGDAQAEEIRGRVILVPFMNTPAFLAGHAHLALRRGQPQPDLPGPARRRRPTEKIADYFARTLVPMADIVLDFHSGGKTLDFLPFAAAHILDDKQQEAACMAAMEAFSAPYSVRMLEIDAVGMYDTEVEGQGKVFVTTELGGGGTARAGTVAIAKRGARNLLIHAGIVSGEIEAGPTTMLDMPDADCFVFAGAGGMLEPLADLGAEVAEGQPLVRIWPLDRTGAAPAEYAARRGGLLTARHFPGLVQPGDCLAVVAQVVG
jgi:N-alpha-acetyl-L-2,4-diaminobutyrate deacetylase